MLGQRLVAAAAVFVAAALGAAAGGGCSPQGVTAPAEPPETFVFPDGMGDGTTPQVPGWLGAELALAPPEEPGVRVAQVLPKSPAALAGLLADDVIVRVDGAAVLRPADVVTRVQQAGAGKRVALAVRRGGKDRLFAVVLAERPSDDELVERSYVGSPAPEFSGLVGVRGNVPFSVGGLKGKVVLLEFWADWCVVCRLLVPTLKEWHERWAGQGVEILAVTTDTVEVAVRSSMEQQLTYAVAADAHGKTSVAYHAYALPSLYVIDQKGVVVDLMVGLDPEKLASIEQLVDRLISAPTSDQPRSKE